MWWFLRPLAPLLDKEVAWGSFVGSISCPLFWGCLVWGRPWEYKEFEFFFFFFGSYGAWGSTPLHLLLSGSVVCDMDMCHAQVNLGVSVPMRPFSFSYIFWGNLFKPLIFLFSFLHFFSVLTLWFLNFSFFSGMPLSSCSFFLLEFYFFPFFLLPFLSFCFLSFLEFCFSFFSVLDGGLFWY